MRRVLVIEDERAVSDVLAEYLGDLGYEVQTARNGEEGLVVMQSFRPDAVILDLMLPVLDVWDLLRRRAKIDALAEIPVLVVSAAGSDGLNEAKELGAAAFLAKPFDVDSLAAVLDTLILRSRSSANAA